jgi:CheY-like chemotaxis protein
MSGERILLVEDNWQNRRLVQFLLTSHGYVVAEATTGLEALELARALLPHLILMDLRLPGMDGYAVTKALKGDDRTRQIPVIALTAFAMEGDREKALAAGCDGYITKPIDTRRFPAAVHRFLQATSHEGVDQGDGHNHENPGGRR